MKNARDTKHDHAKGIGPPGGQVPAYKAPEVFSGESVLREQPRVLGSLIDKNLKICSSDCLYTLCPLP